MAGSVPPPHRTQIPNIIDDLGLDPYERALYVHYKRVCGENQGAYCFEATRTTAGKVKMSTGQVSLARKSLNERGLIIVQAESRPVVVTVVNIWEINISFYKLEHRPDVDGWTLEQVKLWLHDMSTDVHPVNVSSHNDIDTRSPSEHSLTESEPRSPSEHPSIDMSSDVHTVKQRIESLNPVSSPKKESERETHAHKLKRIGEVDYLNQNRLFAVKLSEICGNPGPEYVVNGDRKKLAEATAQLLDFNATIETLDDFRKSYWKFNDPPWVGQVSGQWGRYLSSKHKVPGREKPKNGTGPSPPQSQSRSKSPPIDQDLLERLQAGKE